MATTSIRCRVLGAHVTCVTDLEGSVTTNHLCRVPTGRTGNCRLKKAALGGGPLSQLLERMSEDTLNARSTRCVLQAT